MKEAEDWLSKLGNPITVCKHPHIYLCDVKDIQLDAFKAGMLFAASCITSDVDKGRIVEAHAKTTSLDKY